MKKIILTLLVTCFVAVGCKNEAKEDKKQAIADVKKENIEGVSFKVSGMTCEVGCAKSIASKLSKLEGVVEAEVVFNDSIAKVRFDKTKTDGKKLMAYVDGMTNNMYKTSDMKVCEKKCDVSIKECSKEGAEKKECKDGEKKECSKDKNKTAEADKCPNECCKDKAESKTAASTNNCEKACCEKA